MSTFVWRGEDWMRQHALPAIEAGLDTAAIVVQKHIQTSLNGPRPSRPGQPPAARVGTLRRSIAWARGEQPFTRLVGTNLKYGKILEFGPTGGIVRAKSGKFLTVPLTIEAEQMRRRHKSLRDIPKLRLFRDPNTGKLFLVRDVGGKNARIDFLFLLVKQIRLEARPWLRPGLIGALPKAQRVFVSSVRRRLLNQAGVT